jgi:hypothetical protein
VRNKIIALLVLFAPTIGVRAQSMVVGGFVSFAITDDGSGSSGANAGGACVWQDTTQRCLMVQGGNIFGHSGIYLATGTFNDACVPLKPSHDIQVFPNPGIGFYKATGSNITAVEVCDNLGRVVKYCTFPSTENTERLIDISDQSEGNYFFKVSDADGNTAIFSIIKING